MSLPDHPIVPATSVAVVEAKIASTDAARATLAEHDLDRFWRNARTDAVHDPQLWKYRFIGNYWLNGVKPPRHGAI